MGWARLDDGYSTHPKLVAAGLEATGLDARAISHCAKYETDGFVGEAEVSVLAGDIKKGKALAARLHQVNRWHRPDDKCRCLPDDASQKAEPGWWVHDYLIYNFSHDQLENKREKERLRKAGVVDGNPPHGGPESAPPPHGNRAESASLPSAPSRAGTRAPASRPPPVPPDVSSSSSTTRLGEPRGVEEEEDPRIAEAVAILVERKRHERTVADPIVDLGAWRTATALGVRRDYGADLRGLAAVHPKASAQTLAGQAFVSPCPEPLHKPFDQRPEPVYGDIDGNGFAVKASAK